MRRSDQRREAVFALYQHDVTGQPVDAALRGDARPFTRALAEGVFEHGEELDALIERHAEGWTLERIAPLERAILRVALEDVLERAPGQVLLIEREDGGATLVGAPAHARDM